MFKVQGNNRVWGRRYCRESDGKDTEKWHGNCDCMVIHIYKV